MIKLTMQSQPALIGMQTTPGKQSIKQELPVMEIKQEHAKVEIETSLPKVEIDQRQCFSESGLKSIFELNNDNAANSVNLLQASIGRIVDQGNQLAAIGSGSGNVISEQASYNAFDQFDKDFNMATMPQSRPEIKVTLGTLDLNVTGGKAIMTPRLKDPEINYEPGKVSIYLKQMNSLTITAEGSVFDKKG